MRIFRRKQSDRNSRRIDDLRARSRDMDLGWVDEVRRDRGIESHEPAHRDPRRAPRKPDAGS